MPLDETLILMEVCGENLDLIDDLFVDWSVAYLLWSDFAYLTCGWQLLFVISAVECLFPLSLV